MMCAKRAFLRTPEVEQHGEHRLNVKSRLIKLVLLPLWYGNKDIIRDTLS